MEFGIDGDKAAAELISVANLDQPGVIFRAVMAQGQQLLEHHRDLHAVRCAERVKLQRMAANRQILVVRRSRDRAVDVREPAAIFLVPGPDLWRCVVDRFVMFEAPECAESIAARGGSIVAEVRRWRG